MRPDPVKKTEQFKSIKSNFLQMEPCERTHATHLLAPYALFTITRSSNNFSSAKECPQKILPLVMELSCALNLANQENKKSIFLDYYRENASDNIPDIFNDIFKACNTGSLESMFHYFETMLCCIDDEELFNILIKVQIKVQNIVKP